MLCATTALKLQHSVHFADNIGLCVFLTLMRRSKTACKSG